MVTCSGQMVEFRHAAWMAMQMLPAHVPRPCGISPFWTLRLNATQRGCLTLPCEGPNSHRAAMHHRRWVSRGKCGARKGERNVGMHARRERGRGWEKRERWGLQLARANPSRC